MRKVILLILVLLIVVAVAYEFSRHEADDAVTTSKEEAEREGKPKMEAPRVEEKYGFTTETLLP